MVKESCPVFVYGTLMPGEAYHSSYCAGRCAGSRRARVRGELFSLPEGYPACAPGEGWVKGWLLVFKDAGVLRELDELEGYRPGRPAAENLYQRVRAEVFGSGGASLGEAWLYVMEKERVRRLRGVPIAGGAWKARSRSG